ncbi:MAG TPA: hypothetical protein VHS81_02865, partial [Caulobacteraceae bacterium]|nr:hypothetical protein [Caulobacteraceae bacterium]
AVGRVDDGIANLEIEFALGAHGLWVLSSSAAPTCGGPVASPSAATARPPQKGGFAVAPGRGRPLAKDAFGFDASLEEEGLVV